MQGARQARFFASELENIGGVSSETGKALGGMVGALMAGGGIGLAITAASELGKALHEAAEEARKLIETDFSEIAGGAGEIGKAADAADEHLRRLLGQDTEKAKLEETLVKAQKGVEKLQADLSNTKLYLAEDPLEMVGKLDEAKALVIKAQMDLNRYVEESNAARGMHQVEIEARASKQILDAKLASEKEAAHRQVEIATEAAREEAQKAREAQRAQFDEAALDEDAKRLQRVADERNETEAKRRNDALQRQWDEEDRINLTRAVQGAEEEMAAKQDAWKREHEEHLKDLTQQEQDERRTSMAIAQAWGGALTTAFEAMASGSESAGKAMLKAIVQAAIGSVEAYAASAAAAAAFAEAGIPIVGPVLAATAAAAIGALVMGFISRIPKAAEGGIITGGVSGRDSVPALLMPGELVIPTDMAKNLLGLAHGVGPSRSSPVLGFAGGGVVSRGSSMGRTVNVNMSVTAPITNPQMTSKADVRKWLLSINDEMEGMIRDNLMLRPLVRST